MVVERIGVIAVSDFSLIEDVRSYLQQVPGKLFRPTLLLLASEVEGEAPEEALTLAAAIELVHMATLVHDDAVDNSALRRGMPAVNSLWTHQIAIIMGDYLYSRAVTELARLGDLDAVRVLASAANAMSVGEMRQLLACDDLSYGEDNYYRLISAKTASLISAACELGALAGPRAHSATLRRFGRQLGMAFQIADDILDYVGDDKVTGKPVWPGSARTQGHAPAGWCPETDIPRRSGQDPQTLRDGRTGARRGRRGDRTGWGERGDRVRARQGARVRRRGRGESSCSCRPAQRASRSPRRWRTR